MASLHDEVLATIKQVQKNTRDPHTPEEALQIAQIKALLLIAQVLEERLDSPRRPPVDSCRRPGRRRAIRAGLLR